MLGWGEKGGRRRSGDQERHTRGVGSYKSCVVLATEHWYTGYTRTIVVVLQLHVV